MLKHIYVLQSSTENKLKVGISSNPEIRRRKLELEAGIKYDKFFVSRETLKARMIEYYLLNVKYSKKRLEGEWLRNVAFNEIVGIIEEWLEESDELWQIKINAVDKMG
jgi:hypothetical protein